MSICQTCAPRKIWHFQVWQALFTLYRFSCWRFRSLPTLFKFYCVARICTAVPSFLASFYRCSLLCLNIVDVCNNSVCCHNEELQLHCCILTNVFYLHLGVWLILCQKTITFWEWWKQKSPDMVKIWLHRESWSVCGN